MNTTQPNLLCVETVADLPVIWATLQRIDFVGCCDRLFPPPLSWRRAAHRWQKCSAVWMLFVLSEEDHLPQPRRTLGRRPPRHTLSPALLNGKPVEPKACHDDRLADLLTRLSFSSSWEALERDLNRNTIRVYSLPTDTVRIDTTFTANSYQSSPLSRKRFVTIRSQQGTIPRDHADQDCCGNP